MKIPKIPEKFGNSEFDGKNEKNWNQCKFDENSRNSWQNRTNMSRIGLN